MFVNFTCILEVYRVQLSIRLSVIIFIIKMVMLVHTPRQLPQPVEQSRPFLRHVHCFDPQPVLQLHRTTSSRFAGAASLSLKIGTNLPLSVTSPSPLAEDPDDPSIPALVNTPSSYDMQQQMMLGHNFWLYRFGTISYPLMEPSQHV